jgi:RAB protein geranylgeranyltransferase component A
MINKKEEKITRFPENKQVEFSVISLLLKHKSNVEKSLIFNLTEEDKLLVKIIISNLAKKLNLTFGCSDFQVTVLTTGQVLK